MVQLETDYTPDVYRALIRQFSIRGLRPDEIERLFEDVFNILCRGGTFTITALNRRLASLGWRQDMVDKISFRLIIYLFEKEDSYEVREVSLH